LPAPYTTAGIFPPTRTRRAAFFVPGSRFSASSMLMSVAVAIIPFPSFSKIVVGRQSMVVGKTFLVLASRERLSTNDCS
jgi:hypothetical protein